MNNSSRKKQFGMNIGSADPSGIRDPLPGVFCRTVHRQCQR